MSSSCPICFDDDVATLKQLACGHSGCADCLKRWFETEETTGQSAPTCPVETCRQAVTNSEELLGRPFVPAGSNNNKKRKREPVDASTQKWLDENTLECGGCQTPLVKASGCDKLQCLCGYRVCWNCRAVNAQCSCNPGHAFLDNVTGLPLWQLSNNGNNKVASAAQLADFKTYLSEQRRHQKDPLYQFRRAIRGMDHQGFSGLFPAETQRKRLNRSFGEHNLFATMPMMDPSFQWGPPPPPPSYNNASSLRMSNPFAFPTTNSQRPTATPNPQRKRPLSFSTRMFPPDDDLAKAIRASLTDDHDWEAAIQRSMMGTSILSATRLWNNNGRSRLFGGTESNPVVVIDDDDDSDDKKPAAVAATSSLAGNTASDPLCLDDSSSSDEEGQNKRSGNGKKPRALSDDDDEVNRNHLKPAAASLSQP